jgi:hypothetical protein
VTCRIELRACILKSSGEEPNYFLFKKMLCVVLNVVWHEPDMVWQEARGKTIERERERERRDKKEKVMN